MTIADRLDQAMRDAKFAKQAVLARISGVPQATISRILKGTGKRGPESGTVRKLAQACRVSFEWLNDGIGKHVQVVPSVLPPNHDLLSGEDILRLLNLYRQSTDSARKRIVAYAQEEEKLPHSLKRVI